MVIVIARKIEEERWSAVTTRAVSVANGFTLNA